MYPFRTISPECIALRWFMNKGADTITQFFAIVSTFIVTTLVNNATFNSSNTSTNKAAAVGGAVGGAGTV